MHRIHALISSLVALVCAVGAMGCSSSPSAAPPGCSSNPVSFSKDVMPAFAMSCSLSSSACHAQMNNPQANLYLGMMGGGGGSADANAVHAGLVGVHAKEDPSMNLVTAGDLQNSFLWHKVNDDATTLNQGALATACAKATMAMCTDCSSTTPCGGTMPYLSEPLSTGAPDRLCTIQNWIMQGAQNN